MWNSGSIFDSTRGEIGGKKLTIPRNFRVFLKDKMSSVYRLWELIESKIYAFGMGFALI